MAGVSALRELGVAASEEAESESGVVAAVAGCGVAGGGSAPRWTVMALRRQLSHCCL